MSDFTSVSNNKDQSGFKALPIELQRAIIGIGFVTLLLIGGGIRQFIVSKREKSRFEKELTMENG